MERNPDDFLDANDGLTEQTIDNEAYDTRKKDIENTEDVGSGFGFENEETFNSESTNGFKEYSSLEEFTELLQANNVPQEFVSEMQQAFPEDESTTASITDISGESLTEEEAFSRVLQDNREPKPQPEATQPVNELVQEEAVSEIAEMPDIAESLGEDAVEPAPEVAESRANYESGEQDYEKVNDFYEKLNEEQKKINENKYLNHIDKDENEMGNLIVEDAKQKLEEDIPVLTDKVEPEPAPPQEEEEVSTDGIEVDEHTLPVHEDEPQVEPVPKKAEQSDEELSLEEDIPELKEDPFDINKENEEADKILNELKEKEGIELSLVEEDKEEINPETASEIEQTPKILKRTEATDQETMDLGSKMEQLGLTFDQVESLPGFSELSVGQRFMVFNNLQQLSLDKVQEGAIDLVNEQTSKSGFFKRVWRGAAKNYYIAKAEKQLSKKVQEGGVEEHEAILGQLIKQSNEGPDVLKNSETGDLEIQFVGITEDMPAERIEEAQEFNAVAHAFSQIPNEWAFVKEGSENKMAYEEAKEKFESSKREALKSFKESMTSEDAALKMSSIENKVAMNQFLNTHPEAEAELEKIENQGALRIGFGRAIAERGGYMAVGAIGRVALTGMLGVAAAPIVAGAMGGYRGRKRAKESIEERESLARRGIKDESKEAQKNIIDGTALTEKINKVVERINVEEDPEKRKKLASSLLARLDYTQTKMDTGRVNYGNVEQRIYGQYEMLKATSLAKTTLASVDGRRHNIALERRLDSYMGHVDESIDKKQASYVRKQIVLGAGIGAGYAVLAGVIANQGREWWEGNAEAGEVVPGAVEAPDAEATPLKSNFQEMLEKAKATVGENVESQASPVSFEHEVQSGDNLWNILKDQLGDRLYTEDMSEVQQTHLLDAVKDRFASMSNEELQGMGFNHIGADGRIDINMLDVGDKLDLSKVLTDTEFMTDSLKDTVSLSEEATASIAENLANGEGASEAVAESVTNATETEADVAEATAETNIPVEAVAGDEIAESVPATETLEKNGIVIEEENEVISAEKGEAVLPENEKVPVNFDSESVGNYYESKYGPEVAGKMKGDLEFLFKNNPELYEEWKGNTVWPGMKDQSASDLFNEQHRAYYLKSTRVDGSPSSLTYTNESGEQVTDMMVEAKRNQLFVILDQIKAKGISPTEGETVEDFMGRGYKEIAEIDATPNAVAEATATIESVAGGKIPPQAETPNYTGEQAPETLTAQNVIVPEEPNIKIVNYENLEDLDAKPATLEQLGDQNYLRTQKLSSADYEQLSKVYKNEYRVIEKDLKEIFDSERYEREGLNKAEKLAKARDKKLLDELRDDVRDIKKSNRSKSGLSRFGGELKENLAENRYENARDVSRARIKENFDHGFRHEWSEAKQPIKNMRVEDITDDSFTKLFQRGVNSIEGRNRRQFSEYINDLIQEVPNQPDENIQDYLYRVAGVRGSVSK